MASLNRVMLIGNVVRSPELRQTPSGAMVTQLSLAINERYKDRNGETRETTCFVDVVVWGRSADACAAHLDKGSQVLVEGALQLDQWETQAGDKRSKLRVKAHGVAFLDGKKPARREQAVPDKKPIDTEDNPLF